MSFEISPIQPTPASTPARAPNGAAPIAAAPANAPAAEPVKPAAEPVKVDTIPSAPPPEVLDAMGVAAAQHDRLAATGRGLSFKIDDATGKLIIAVHDARGKVLFTLPPAKALEFAGGGSLD
jgi:hypothetical protein